MEALRRALPQAGVTNAYGTTEAGPVVFGPHPEGLPQPELSVGYPHPKVAASPRRRRQSRRRRRRAGDEVPRRDARLSQPAGAAGADHRRRLLRHRRRVPPRRARLPLFRRPHRRHVRVGRREHLSGRRRAHAGAPSRHRAGVRGADRRRHQGPEAGRLRDPQARPHGRARTTSSASRWPTRRPTSTRASSGSSTTLPLASTNKVDRAALQRVAEERVAAAGANVATPP